MNDDTMEKDNSRKINDECLSLYTIYYTHIEVIKGMNSMMLAMDCNLIRPSESTNVAKTIIM